MKAFSCEGVHAEKLVVKHPLLFNDRALITVLNSHPGTCSWHPYVEGVGAGSKRIHTYLDTVDHRGFAL